MIIISRISRCCSGGGHTPDEALLPVGSHLVSVGGIRDLLKWAHGPCVKKQGQRKAVGFLSGSACQGKEFGSLPLALVHSPPVASACFLTWASGLHRAKSGIG